MSVSMSGWDLNLDPISFKIKALPLNYSWISDVTFVCQNLLIHKKIHEMLKFCEFNFQIVFLTGNR